ncbi:EAL domain-containing protein [Oxalobacteraceae bacterium R-40]|uniref:EAL domain-containing protein n=1 Tax=Keguizhuia sedimenti TaxID=3064264 RepID=A0ABU1BPE4_9BURK|nr:EAL domain-containing protein [Oxalobacteraceae bacterium R-40]
MPFLAVIAAATGWVSFLTNLEASRHKIEEQGLQAAAALSQDNAKDLLHTLEAVDHITYYIKSGWEASNGRLTLESASQIKDVPEDFSFYITIIDENANLLLSTVPNPYRANVLNRPYFSAHRQARDVFYAGPAQVGDFSRRPIIPFSRRLSDSRGNFNGIVLVSVVPGNFISGYDDAVLKNHGILAVMGADRSMRLARLGKQLVLPQSPLLTDTLSFEYPSGSTLLNGKEWFADGRNRYVGWETIDEYDFILFTGLDQEEFLAPYKAERAALIRNAILLTIVLGLLSLAATMSIMLHAWRRCQLETMQETYRAATEGADEGFYIASPIRNEDGKVVDFRFTDCNERGAEFLGYRRQELIGKRILELYHGEVANRTMRMLCYAMKHRSYEGETDMTSLGIEGPAWLHIRISRPENDLAITVRDISHAKAHVFELERRSNEDALTGLPNRHWVTNFLPDALQQATISRTTVALLFIDLDGFKAVNDTMGHEAGDEVLRNAGRRLKEAVRPHDPIVRLGGDEFLVILEHLTNNNEAAHVAERIMEAFRPPFRVSQGTHSIGTSIGISMFPKDGKEAHTLLKNADIAMYSVKAAGKCGYHFFDESFYDALVSRHQREKELRYALDHDQMVVFYQPKVDIATGTTSSLEALVRWAHPTQGIVAPNEFISLAQETGLIARLGEQVIEKVCAQLAYWSEHTQQLVPVAINISPTHFQNGNIVEVLSSCMKRYGIPASLIELEITESTMLENTEEVTQAINALRKMGVTLSVDDFGTGYSSLSQLHSLNFDVLKVDRAFTVRLNRSKDGNILFTTIIKMAHSLGMRVVAEGVETLEQIKTLKAMQCDEIQGFYISQPLPPADAQPVLPKWFFPSIM